MSSVRSAFRQLTLSNQGVERKPQDIIVPWVGIWSVPVFHLLIFTQVTHGRTNRNASPPPKKKKKSQLISMPGQCLCVQSPSAAVSLSPLELCRPTKPPNAFSHRESGSRAWLSMHVKHNLVKRASKHDVHRCVHARLCVWQREKRHAVKKKKRERD